MRVRAANCMLLICLATAALAEPEAARPKRHLQQWKDAILSKIFGNCSSKEDNVRFFRIPGHDNILVKAVPKIDTVETAVVAPAKIDDASPTIAILKSYLGTKSASETMSALQGVKHLLQSGILSVRHEPPVVVPYEKSGFLAPPYVSQGIEFINPRLGVISGPPKIPLIPVLPPAAEAPQVVEELIPVHAIPTKVPELIPYPKFSYKQLKKDGTVMTYTVRDDISSDVVVTETYEPMPRPPSFIVDRVRKMFLGLPLGTQEPVRPLPPPPSLMPIEHLPFESYSPSVIPPIHTMISVPRGEVKVHTYPLRKVMVNGKLGSFTSSSELKGANEKIIIEKSALEMPPPPRFIVDRIENVAEVSAHVPKAKKPSASSGHKQEFLLNPGHVFYNPQTFIAPLTSGYVYRQPLRSNPFSSANIVDRTAYGDVTVKVHSKDVTAKPNEYYFQQIQHGLHSKIPSNPRPFVLVREPVHKMPVPPVHIIERIQNVAAKAHAASAPKISKGYAFKINHGLYVNSNKFSGEQSKMKNEETGIAKPEKVKNNENPGAVYFAGPVPSSYVYKQISHSNPQPFTVVQVEDKAIYKPAVVTNVHKHVRPDGSSYKCEEKHVDLSKDYIYVPPTAAEEPLPTTHKVERLGSNESHFSYVQMTNRDVFTNKDGAGAGPSEDKRSVSDAKVSGGNSSSKNSGSLSENPIVVPETTYSFTQTHADGSTVNIHNDDGKGVTVELSESARSSPRGDIP